MIKPRRLSVAHVVIAYIVAMVVFCVAVAIQTERSIADMNAKFDQLDENLDRTRRIIRETSVSGDHVIEKLDRVEDRLDAVIADRSKR